MRYQVLCIDALNMAHRVHAIMGSHLSVRIDDERVGTGMVYGFIKMAASVFDMYAAMPGTALIVAWEGNEIVNHRRDAYAGYKAHRGPKPGDFNEQIELLQFFLTQLGISQVSSPGWEADDSCGTIARIMEDEGKTVGIVSGDHDLHQCVTENIHIIDHRQDLVWDLEQVEEKWSIEPPRIAEVKALYGDRSDGYPGASGFGKKWAVGVITTYGSIAAATAAAKASGNLTINVGGKSISSGAKAETLIREEEIISTFLEIATIQTDVDLDFVERRYSPGEIKRIFEKFRFSSLTQPHYMRILDRMAGKLV